MKLFKNILTLLILLLCIVPYATADDQREQVLELNSYILWQQINRVRHSPAAYLERLGITRLQAETALGDNAWILDGGLSPVAWNDTLHSVAQLHGDDMLSNFYYSKIALDGWTPAMRIEASGYDAVSVGESLGIIAFSNYIEIEQAVEYLLDNILRDELSGNYANEINIFSPDLTEVGIAIFAEMLELVDGQSYVYLAVIDFASPVQPRNYVIANTDNDNIVSFYSFEDSTLTALVPLALGGYQLPISAHGGVIVARKQDQELVAWRFVPVLPVEKNSFFDLR